MYVSMDSGSWELRDDVLDFELCVVLIVCGRFGNGACIVCLEKYLSPSKGGCLWYFGKNTVVPGPRYGGYAGGVVVR